MTIMNPAFVPNPAEFTAGVIRKAEALAATFDIIIDYVACQFDIDASILRRRSSRRRTQHVAEVRFLCFRLCKRITGASMHVIGCHFRFRGHDTIKWGLHRCQDLIDIDPNYKQLAERLEREISACMFIGLINSRSEVFCASNPKFILSLAA